MPRRRKLEPVDSPEVVVALQIALDIAHLRVSELESICETLNERVGQSNDRADAAELALWQSRMLDEAGQVALNNNATPPVKGTKPVHRRVSH